MLSPDQMDSKSYQLSIYSSSSHLEPNFNVKNNDSIQIQTNAGLSSIYSASNATIELEADYDALTALFVAKPRDGFVYKFKLGQIKDFDLLYSSGAHTNTFSSFNDGYVFGLGVRWNVSQGTMVSPAVNIDLSFNRLQVRFDRFESNGNVFSVSDDFQIEELQSAVSTSYRWKKIEPYIGLKVLRQYSKLRDNMTTQMMRGVNDEIAAMLGLKLEIFDRENLIIEASFLGEESISAGLGINF